MKHLRLCAVRLVGFHNYEDVSIRVRGDLFVVGANESGKTTLLDAVHLALSGEQDLDWNAAASLAGPRRSGRTLQGIILRANMAGQSTRLGGSISYAVAELEPVDGEGGPTSLVFGASAMDMHTQVQKWGAVVAGSAKDLPLTEQLADGTQRILDRDEFEAILGQRIHKGSRGLGDYRTSVASKLFSGREQFDEVTRLWRTAKSYREIAGTAQNVGEVFRQVLPAPNPEPFQKIAKGFRDIAGIESDLLELSRDVELLHKLRALVEETREARETYRRYAYVRESWRQRDHRTKLQQTHSKRDSATVQAEGLRQQISRHEAQDSLVKERLAIVRESDNYKLLASLEAKEHELQRSDNRIADLHEKLRHEKVRFETSQAHCEQKRKSAVQALADARDGLERICERLSQCSLETTNDVRLLLSRLPSQIDDQFNADAISNSIAAVRKRHDDAISRTNERISEASGQVQRLEQEIREPIKQLRRIEQFDDLVPPLPKLDEVLLKLQQEGIRYMLLFQYLEWQPGAPSALQSAVEAALGQERMGTIVVPPEQTETARNLVLSAGPCLRVLDASAVDFSRPIEPDDASRLLDFLEISEPRVRAHLEATVAAIVLHREMPPDGANAQWFATDGRGGERGARWRLDLDEPRWVGERHRQEIRQRDQQRLQQSVNALQERMTKLEDDTVLLQSMFQSLRDSRDAIEQLALPWSIIQPLNDWRHVSDSTAELARLIGERTADLDGSSSQRKELLELITGLRSQIDGTDAAVIKEQVDQLEFQKNELDDRLVKDCVELETTLARIEGFNEQIAMCESDSAETQRRLEVAHASLLAVLPREQTGELDHYVFDMKRGSQLKEEHLEDNIAKAREWEIELKTKLGGADGVLGDKLAIRYGFRLEDDDALLVIRDRGNLELDSILEERRGQERQMKESLNAKTRELFETILARDLTERLRADLFQARRTKIEINKKLSPLVFGHSRFQLSERHVAEYRPLVELIERQTLLNTEQRDELRHYLEDRRDQLMDEGEVPPFLDYRNWFEYSFKLEHVGSAAEESLGSEDMVRGSVGVQTTHNYLLLLAQAALLFDRCQARLRLLMLDDAFYGVDMQRKELLLKCGKQLGLDFVIATPDLDGTIQEHAGDSTTLLVECDCNGSVSVLPFEWERIPLQPELFSEPRPEAILGVKEVSHEP